MSKRIWKYDMAGGICSISMPKGAEILCVQMQFKVPRIWAIVDPDVPNEVRTFHIVDTGSPVDVLSVEDYIGTFQEHEGNRIYHLFEVKE